MADKILLENGVDRLLLEDGTSFLLLEGTDTAAQYRAPVFSTRHKKPNINGILFLNLLENTLGQLPTVTGTLVYTNANDTSAAQGSPIGTGSLARTNNNDTSSAQGTPVGIGSLTRTNADDTSAASGSPINVGTVNYTNINDSLSAAGTTTIVGTLSRTNNNDTLAASGAASSEPPFFSIPIERVQRRSINTILYGSRGVNAQPPVVPVAPLRPDIFIAAIRKPNRFTSFDYPNLLTTVFEYQKIASSYPESVFIQRRVFATNMDFPNLVVKGVQPGIIGTLAYTNNNDTSTGTGNTTIISLLTTTNNNDTSTGNGSPVGSGSVARTNNNDTSVGQGTTAPVGTLAKTNNNDTLEASGTAVDVPAGTLSYTNNNDTLNAQGTVVDTGSLNKSNNNDALLAFGTAGIASGVTTRLPMTGVGS